MWSGLNAWEFVRRPLWTINQYPEGERIEECAQRRQNDSDKDYKRGVPKELNVVMMHPLCSLFIPTYTARSACADSFVLFLCVFYNVNIHRVGGQMAGHKTTRLYDFCLLRKVRLLATAPEPAGGVGTHTHAGRNRHRGGWEAPFPWAGPRHGFYWCRPDGAGDCHNSPGIVQASTPGVGNGNVAAEAVPFFTPEKPQKGQVTSVADTSPGSRQAALGFPLGVKGGQNSPPGSPDTRG